ncbi:hypothetical protein [Acinetobacter sp.]|uniref:hypothetical protein n=1 Tax=Acinetobacter sp. TaxID=472 RepID=UPI0035B49661
MNNVQSNGKASTARPNSHAVDAHYMDHAEYLGIYSFKSKNHSEAAAFSAA